MHVISKVISSKVEGFRRRIKALVMGKGDTRNLYECMPFGEDSVPPKGWRAVVAPTRDKEKMVVVGYINQRQLDELYEGEKRLYSIGENGEIATFIKLDKEGIIHLGGEDDFAVRFNALKTAFDQLKSDFNSHVDTYNAHVHPGVTVGAGSTLATLSTGTPSNADIDPAKIESIKTP